MFLLKNDNILSNHIKNTVLPFASTPQGRFKSVMIQMNGGWTFNKA